MMREQDHSANMMSLNVEVSQCLSMDGSWDLFGGEMKLDAVSCDSDATFNADSSEELSWQSVESDTLSVCSSATSWSCLHGSGIHETYSEMYRDLCEPETVKLDVLWPNDLLDDVTRCMSSDPPLSLEQFYELSRMLDAEADLESNECAGVINTEVDNCHSKEISDSFVGDEEVTVSKVSSHADSIEFSANRTNSITDPYSSDVAMASLDDEELYEESVDVEDDFSTISPTDFHDQRMGVHERSFPEHGSSPHLRLCRRSTAEPSSSRRLRKKEQNKSAALRYRLKKRSEQGLVVSEYAMLERRNIELKTRLDAMTHEISYLKSLIEELCP